MGPVTVRPFKLLVAALIFADGAAPLPREEFYIPGSILRAKVDTSNPLAFGSAVPVRPGH
jgi:hypothetical protein